MPTPALDTFVDEIVVYRLVRGEIPLPRATPAEKRAAAVEMARRGESQQSISRRITTSGTTVTKWLRQEGVIDDAEEEEL